jgi:hypothetical protein
MYWTSLIAHYPHPCMENEMNLNELIEALDQRYGNPYATDCHLIQQAIAELRMLQEEVIALRGQVK